MDTASSLPNTTSGAGDLEPCLAEIIRDYINLQHDAVTSKVLQRLKPHIFAHHLCVELSADERRTSTRKLLFLFKRLFLKHVDFSANDKCFVYGSALLLDKKSAYPSSEDMFASYEKFQSDKWTHGQGVNKVKTRLYQKCNEKMKTFVDKVMKIVFPDNDDTDTDVGGDDEDSSTSAGSSPTTRAVRHPHHPHTRSSGSKRQKTRDDRGEGDGAAGDAGAMPCVHQEEEQCDKECAHKWIAFLWSRYVSDLSIYDPPHSLPLPLKNNTYQRSLQTVEYLITRVNVNK